jgi:hypothetical protein
VHALAAASCAVDKPKLIAAEAELLSLTAP